MALPITDVSAFALRLPFISEFRIARGSVGSPTAGAPHIYVRVTAEDGTVGWGEARPSHRWSYETEESVLTTIRGYLAPALLGRNAFDLAGIQRVMHTEIAPGLTVGQPIAKSAIDIAVHDLLGRHLGIGLSDVLGSHGPRDVALSWLISTTDPKEAADLATDASARGYRGLKVKVGVQVEHDLDLLAAVKQAAPAAYLWADANGSYDVAQAKRLARGMAAIGIDVLEQPLPANDLAGLRSLRAAMDLPLALDESICSGADLIAALRHEALDMLVIKVCKMGGLWPARRMMEMAGEAGVDLLGSGLTESRLGLAAGAGLFSAFGLRHPVDLNGPQFLGDDPVAVGPVITDGVIHLPDGPGLGTTLDHDKLERYRSPGS
jgi:muconate cycloisomerase